MDEHKELLKALNVIRETCKSQLNCKDCPLRNQFNECMIKNGTVPEHWTFVGEATDRLIV